MTLEDIIKKELKLIELWPFNKCYGWFIQNM